MSNISTALEIQQACTQSVFNDENLIIAAEIANATDFNPEVMALLLKYSASLTADVATRVTTILMPHDEIQAMISELQEVEAFDVN